MNMAPLARFFNIALATVCIMSMMVARSDSQASIRPSMHGLNTENSPGKASPAMVAFFSKAHTELPEAENIPDQMWKPAAKVAPADPGSTRGHARPGLLVAGIVFAVLGAGLLVTAAAAYVIHARRAKARSASNSFVGLGPWNEL